MGPGVPIAPDSPLWPVGPVHPVDPVFSALCGFCEVRAQIRFFVAMNATEKFEAMLTPKLQNKPLLASGD